MTRSESDASPTEKPHRRAHDATYLWIFSEPIVVREMLEIHCKQWVKSELIDYDSLRRLQGQFVTPEGERRTLDIAWTARYGGDRDLVCIMEFQSTRDPDMLIRLMEYGHRLLVDLFRSKRMRSDNPASPHGLAIVIYNGEEDWTPQGSHGIDGPPPGRNGLAARPHPWWSFLFVNIRKLARDQAALDTLVVWLGRAEATRDKKELLELADAVLKRYNDYADLKHAIMLWICELTRTWVDDPKIKWPEPKRLEDVAMVFGPVDRAKARIRAEALAKGRAEDVAMVVRRRLAPDERRLAVLLDTTNGAAGRPELMMAALDSDTFDEFEVAVRRLIEECRQA